MYSAHPFQPKLDTCEAWRWTTSRGRPSRSPAPPAASGRHRKALLARGARVVIGDRDVAFQECAVADLTELGQVSGYPLDVTDRESFATFLDKARTDGAGRIDVLINNAGVMPIGPFLEQSEQAIRSSIEVNLYGVIAGCQLVLPDMIARRSGHIINIASLSGLIPVPGQVVYVGAKFGVVGLSAALADEVAPHGVDVSVIMPPFTNTELISGTKPAAPSSRSSRRTSRPRSSRPWRSRKPMSPSRLRCGSPPRPRRCSARAAAGGSTNGSGSTACS